MACQFDRSVQIEVPEQEPDVVKFLSVRCLRF